MASRDGTAYILVSYTHPNCRRRGLQRLMIAFVSHILGATRLIRQANNTPGQERVTLSERLGFVVTSSAKMFVLSTEGRQVQHPMLADAPLINDRGTCIGMEKRIRAAVDGFISPPTPPPDDGHRPNDGGAGDYAGGSGDNGHKHTQRPGESLARSTSRVNNHGAGAGGGTPGRSMRVDTLVRQFCSKLYTRALTCINTLLFSRVGYAIFHADRHDMAPTLSAISNSSAGMTAWADFAQQRLAELGANTADALDMLCHSVANDLSSAYTFGFKSTGSPLDDYYDAVHAEGGTTCFAIALKELEPFATDVMSPAPPPAQSVFDNPDLASLIVVHTLASVSRTTPDLTIKEFGMDLGHLSMVSTALYLAYADVFIAFLAAKYRALHLHPGHVADAARIDHIVRRNTRYNTDDVFKGIFDAVVRRDDFNDIYLTESLDDIMLMHLDERLARQLVFEDNDSHTHAPSHAPSSEQIVAHLISTEPRIMLQQMLHNKARWMQRWTAPDFVGCEQCLMMLPFECECDHVCCDCDVDDDDTDGDEATDDDDAGGSDK